MNHTFEQLLALRDAWALRAPLPDKDQLGYMSQRDRNLNPHNDNYKPPLRSEKELVSDYVYAYADQMLTRQYKKEYESFLKQIGFVYVEHLGSWAGDHRRGERRV